VARIHAQHQAALLFAGRYDDAESLADPLRPIHENNDADEATTVMIERLLAWMLVRAGRLDEAEAFIDDGLRRGEAMEARYEVGLLCHARAELRRARGDTDAAGAEQSRGDELLGSLGVVALPLVPARGAA
jgi:hypothetical protein